MDTTDLQFGSLPLVIHSSVRGGTNRLEIISTLGSGLREGTPSTIYANTNQKA